MRILYFYSWQHFNTGSPRMLATTVEMLNRRAHEPFFLATGDGPLISALEERGVQILRHRVHELGSRQPVRAATRVAAAARWLRRHRIEILHINEFGWNLDIVVGAWLARIPVVLHVHTPLRVHARNLHRLAAWRVIFVSEAHRRETVGLELIAGKSRVLHNAIDISRYAAGRNIRHELGLSPDMTVVATVCQLSQRKAVDVLLDVAEQLIPRHRDLCFVVVGPPARGEEQYAAWQQERAGQPQFDGRVRFLGSRSDVPDILRSADIFFLPTRHETYGLVVAEAMAASLPVVASNVGGIPEIIRSAAHGLLIPVDDRAGFVGALELLIHSPERCEIIGRAARASLDGRFDRETFSRALDALYAGT